MSANNPIETAMLGFLPSVGIALVIGNPVIGALKRFGAKQTVSDNAPQSHSAKQGTPTMGGIILLLAAVPSSVWAVSQTPGGVAATAALALMIGMGLIGLLDDALISLRGKNLGLRAREKFTLQVIVTLGFVAWLRFTATAGRTTWLTVGGNVGANLGEAYYPLCALFILGFTNAVNFCDGLDGLAAGICILLAGWITLAGPSSPSAAPLIIVSGAMGGACLGFLWFNSHPASVFMGDTGSLALGGGLAALCVLGKVEVPFQLAGGLVWAALFSVIIQVSVFKWLKRKRGLEYAQTHRVFRRTPLHHHFEEIGWNETRVVQRAWVATGILCGGAFLLS